MSKNRRRDVHVRKPHHPGHEPAADTPRKLPQLLRSPKFVIALFAVLAAICFGLGKYFELSTPGAYDSGAYVYSAAHVLDGAKIGVDELPSAQLGTLLVNMLGVKLFGFSDTGPKIIQGLMQLAALVLLFFAMKRAFGYFPASIGMFLASAYLSSPLIAKYGNVKEQYMIACMVAGISLFVFYQYSGKWYQALLAGAILVWGPLFKQTGLSAVGAVGLFVIAQPFLKHRSFKQMGVDIGLLLAGAAISVAPVFIWILGWGVKMALPYQFVWDILGGLLPSSAAQQGAVAATSYVSGARKLIPFSEQFPRVMRYYGLFALPIALALGSIISRIVTFLAARKRGTTQKDPIRGRLVLLLAIWWILDMAFVWISPRSYEQYYLPLNASAAMLAGYCLALYFDGMANAEYKGKWRFAGVLGAIAMVYLSYSIFAGVRHSPFSGVDYGSRRSGYYQRYEEVRTIAEAMAKRPGWYPYPWQRVAHYIRENSTPQDTMYVWGWYPGIYVAAQRFSSAAKACSMPRPSPPEMVKLVDDLLTQFKKKMPKFIVDSRKRHIPMNRPPYELWPVIKGDASGKRRPMFLPTLPNVIADYDKAWSAMLAKTFDSDEAARFDALAPLRQFIVDNYEIVDQRGYQPTRYGDLYSPQFGEHVVFRLKSSRNQ